MYHTDHSCDFVVLNFSKGSKVDFSEEIICQEPPVSIGFISGDHFFHYSLKQKNENLILTVENKFSKQSFKIIELKEIDLWEKEDKCKELILVRVK